MGVTTPTIMNQTTCDVEGSSNIPNIKAQAIIQIIVNMKIIVALSNSPKKANKIRCGNYICFILFSGFSHCLGMDKTIATHTNFDNI